MRGLVALALLACAGHGFQFSFAPRRAKMANPMVERGPGRVSETALRSAVLDSPAVSSGAAGDDPLARPPASPRPPASVYGLETSPV